MPNLVINQHGTYTFRKFVSGSSLRVSLRTKDRLEALRITNQLNSVLEVASSDDPEQVRSIIFASLNHFQPVFQKERLSRVENLLGISLEVDKGEVLSVIIKRYIEEKLRSKSWTDKTHETYKVILRCLIDLLGDIGIKTISHQQAQSIKNQLQRLPSSMGKRPQYRNKTLKQILKMKIPENHLMSVKTINTRLGCYSELFKWAMKNGYAEKNVFEGLALADTRNSRDLRLPFCPKDLSRLFSSKTITEPKVPWQYWLPILALYTGARLNELCQLQRKDILQQEGIWAISINCDGEGQHLKSTSSKRLIPIHSEVLKLGLLEYVQATCPTKTCRLFPELTIRNQRFSHTPSKWFGRVKGSILIDSDKKSFHSFRHTFVDYLFNKLKLQGNPLVKALTGHTDKEVTSGVYGSSFTIEDLHRIIEGICFKEYGVSVPKLPRSTLT